MSYRDPDFWRKFHERHWLPRVPTVLRQPFREFPFSEASVLRALSAVEAGLRDGNERIRYIVSVGAAEKAPRHRLRELLRHESGSMAQLEQNCNRAYRKQSFGLMLHELQMLDPDIWSGITSFLQDAHRWIDFPVARAFLDLFIGNYSKSFLGLHKDTQEIFAFVLREEKRILAWPFEYFLPRVKGLSPAARYFQERLPVDYRKYRKDAVVLDARPGDVLYWPSDHWHIAEAKPGRFSAMLSLGLFRPEHVLPSRNEKRARFRERLMSGGTAGGLRSQAMTEVTAGADAARQLRWATGFGFEQGGPVAGAAAGAPRANGTVRKRKDSLLLWKVDASRGRVLVAANGHSVTLPHSSGLVTLLERAARGEPIAASPSRRRARRDGEKIFETHWNNQGELETRGRASGGDCGGWLVRWLLRVHAADPSPAD